MRVNLSRRDFLRAGSLAVGGLQLEHLLAASPQDTSCIVFFQSGGASQLDTFDPKPDAPLEVRGSFKSIPTAVPGVHFTEHLPKCAAAFKRFAVIRSMYSKEAIHEKAKQYLWTGNRPGNAFLNPSIGAVVSKELGPRNGLPPFVTIPGKDFGTESGFLGSAYDPFTTGNPNTKKFSVRDLALPNGLTMDEAQSRAKLLGALDDEIRRVEKSDLIESMDQFQQKALDLIASPAAKKAFNLEEEPDKLRDTYGRTTSGQGLLLARRLVEAGVRMVSVFQGGYDTHTDNEKGHKKILPEFDQALPALLEDLEQRGRLDSTLVIAMGEFGRTPKINFSAGRDHWPGAFSIVAAGTGIQGGMVIGKTDAHAGEPADRPVSVEDLAATIYEKLGVNHNKVYRAYGRPIAILAGGKPIRELMG